MRHPDRLESFGIVTFLIGIGDMEFFGLLCDAAELFNSTHATDERVFVQPAQTDGTRAKQFYIFNWKEQT
jgi:hypothetical protein